MSPITFTDDDFKGVDPSQDDLMVISIDMDNFTIMKTLVDKVSSVDILHWKTLNAMRIPIEEMMPYDDHVVGFSGGRVGTKGYIELYTTFGLNKASKTLRIRYLVIEANTSYNILLGWSSLNKLGAIVSNLHLAMKFPSLSGDILTIHVDQKIARECYVESLRMEPLSRRSPTVTHPSAKCLDEEGLP
ncbi:uncharacterized protein [Phaseolus vulgaris]|uniref:uncharacterized protein n=1 Tax=Phaseolus vulgaris TaxID=3885 RepID=UPI0035CC0BA0